PRGASAMLQHEVEPRLTNDSDNRLRVTDFAVVDPGQDTGEGALDALVELVALGGRGPRRETCGEKQVNDFTGEARCGPDRSPRLHVLGRDPRFLEQLTPRARLGTLPRGERPGGNLPQGSRRGVAKLAQHQN